MNDNTITIPVEEYAELTEARIRLNILANYIDEDLRQGYSAYEDLARIIGIKRQKEVRRHEAV